MYTITLQDAPTDIPERVRQEAEDTAETEMTAADIELAKRWITAAGRARGDAFQNPGA